MKFKLKDEVILKVHNEYYEKEMGITPEPLNIIKFIGAEPIKGTEFNGVEYHYIAKEPNGKIYFFSITYTHQTKKLEYIWGSYLEELFPNVTDYTLESFKEKININILNFMYSTSEY